MPIFDQGYQHWQGPLSGHAWRWLAIAQHGVRVQTKNRILRLLLLFAWLPALLLVTVVALWGLVEQKNESIVALARNLLPPEVVRDPVAYRAMVWTLVYSFFFQIEMFFIMLLVIFAGPGLISRDLRFNALPLYFARPLTRLDYFLGKLGVIGALVAAVAVGPAVVAYLVGVCFSFDLSVVRDTYPVLLASVAYGLVITLSTGTLMLALSSLTRRSLYVAIAFAGLWIISGSVGSIMTGIHRESLTRGVQQDVMSRWVAEHPPPPGVHMHGTYPALQFQPGTGKVGLAGIQPENQREADRWYRDWSEASQMAWLHAQERQTEALREDWRPLCSYVANLSRMADLLLDTDTAWVTLGKAGTQPPPKGPAGGGRRGPQFDPPQISERRLADQMVAQYPWWWSATVLTGLLGLSTWTLTRRVKSLDRLK
jgi:ABC-2 type transport system permease protein